jgi:hypothetical protein
VERVTRNVKRWRGGDQAQRWTATGLLEAEKKFRRVKGYRGLEGLHRRMNPLSLTQQARVAQRAEHREPLQSTATGTTSASRTQLHRARRTVSHTILADHERSACRPTGGNRARGGLNDGEAEGWRASRDSESCAAKLRGVRILLTEVARGRARRRGVRGCAAAASGLS